MQSFPSQGFGAVYAATWASGGEAGGSKTTIIVVGTSSGRIFVYVWDSVEVCIIQLHLFLSGRFRHSV